MTLIECLDREPIRNIAGCLELRPDKLIFLGTQAQLDGCVRRYEKFLAGRGLHTQVVPVCVDLQDRVDIENNLQKLLEKEKDCTIDVTGGGEPVLLAVGAVTAGRNVRLHTADLQSAALTVSELIFLHGGVIHPKSSQPAMTARASQLQPLWEIASRDPREWNYRMGILQELENRSESEEEIDLYISDLERSISDFRGKEPIIRDLLDSLHRADVIRDRSSFGRIRYTYSDPLLHECVKKAGNLLEMKTLLEARALREQGEAYFDAALMSVTIDWDGVIHEKREWVAETRNEVDVLLTRGMIPLFISCKNGKVEEGELYKLNTVAERFGGSYARKMLIVSRLDQGSDMANRALERRARDMGVHLVTDAAALDSARWKQALKDAMEGKL